MWDDCNEEDTHAAVQLLPDGDSGGELAAAALCGTIIDAGSGEALDATQLRIYNQGYAAGYAASRDELDGMERALRDAEEEREQFARAAVETSDACTIAVDAAQRQTGESIALLEKERAATAQLSAAVVQLHNEKAALARDVAAAEEASAGARAARAEAEQQAAGVRREMELLSAAHSEERQQLSRLAKDSRELAQARRKLIDERDEARTLLQRCRDSLAAMQTRLDEAARRTVEAANSITIPLRGIDGDEDVACVTPDDIAVMSVDEYRVAMAELTNTRNAFVAASRRATAARRRRQSGSK